MAARWVIDNLATLRTMDPEIPSGLHDRAADNWRPLLAIADRADGDWPELARTTALNLSVVEDGDGSAKTQLLADLKLIFEEAGQDQISTVEILEKLIDMEDRPWPEWYRGKPLSSRQLARLLKPFKVSPGTVRTSAGTPKGYRLETLKDAFTRYLPSQSATTPQPLETSHLSLNLSATNEPGVADRKTPKPAVGKDCGVVADRNPQKGGGME